MRLIAISLLFLISLFYFSRRLKKQNFDSTNSVKLINIKQWMRISSAERNEIDNESRLQTMRRKKNLLKKIRSEYRTFLNSKKNIR